MTPANLREALRERRADAMIRQAETIHNWPLGSERHKQAEIHVRLGLWEEGMGSITDQTEQIIFSTLCFVLPDEGTFSEESTPLEALEREAEWELEYHEQLDRQDCPE